MTFKIDYHFNRLIFNISPLSSILYCFGAILNKFFNLYGIRNQTWVCQNGKDAAEIIFEKKLDLDDITPVSITKEMLGKQDLSFDFLKYLTGRTF